MEIILILVGFIFIITSGFMQIFKPTAINKWYGYRTPASMRNASNWRFAQKRGSLVIAITGIILLALSSLLNMLNISQKMTELSEIGIVIIAVIAMIYKIEKDIKKFEQSSPTH
jgi:uncharacterized membrane protein